MALSSGTGPFGEQPAGHFDVAPPTRPLLFWEPFPKRLRVNAGGAQVVDSHRVLALHETGEMMRLCVPTADVDESHLIPSGDSEPDERLGPLTLLSWSGHNGPAPVRLIGAPPVAARELAGHMLFELAAADAWYLEDEPGYAHPRDPYHRFDVHRTSRHVVVWHGADVIAESHAPAMLFETGLPPRFYVPPEAVVPGLLTRSDTVSQCPYKGDGQHWHVETGGSRVADAAWNLTTPMGDALAIARWFSFYTDKLKVFVDGERWHGG